MGAMDAPPRPRLALRAPHAAVLAALLGACAPPQGDPGPDGGVPDDGAVDPCAGGPTEADLFAGDASIVVPARAWSSSALPLAAILGDVDGLAVAWEVAAGTLDDPSSRTPVWTTPTEFSGNLLDTEVRLVATHPCAEARTAAAVTVVRRDVERVVIVVNADVPEGLDVADHYAAARGIPEGQVVSVSAGTDSILSIEEFDDRIGGPVREWLQDTGMGERATYFVTVLGMPYHVEGLTPPSWYDADAYGWWPVSLDSVLGAVGAGTGPFGTEGLMPNPLYMEADSAALAYPERRRALDAVAETGGGFIPVSRLDGPTVEDAMALVDRALEGEDLARSGALDGIAYVDRQYAEDPALDDLGSYESVEWMLEATATLLEGWGWPVVLDTHPEEFGTPPAPTDCPDALWYSGWYSYDYYPECFAWAPGAIGMHFDSCSACSLKGGSNFAVNAVLDGITATAGAANEPFVFGLPEMDQLWWHLGGGANLAEAVWQSTYFARWMTVAVGDPLYAPFDPDRAP